MVLENQHNNDSDEWIQCTKSLWDGRKIDVIKRIISIFTNPDEVVLDPFMGTGSTLLAANVLDRKAIGFEINEKYISVADEKLKRYKDSYYIICDSCINISKYLYEESVDLCITSLPYWKIPNKFNSTNRKHNDYTLLMKNIGNTNSYTSYLKNLSKVFLGVYEVLKPDKMCIVIVTDRRKRNKFYPIHMDLTNVMAETGFILEDLMIWDRSKEHSILKVVDNTCIYKSNIVHEYICVYKKVIKGREIL